MIGPSDPNSLDNAGRGGHRSDPTTTMSPGPLTTTAHASPMSTHKVRRRGLTLGLATLALIGIAIVWTAWPAVREPVHRKDEEAGSPQNSRVLPPREIASRARGATVQIRGYDIDKRL